MKKGKIIIVGAITIVASLLVILILLLSPVGLPEEYCHTWVFDEQLTEDTSGEKLSDFTRQRQQGTSVSFQPDGKMVAVFRFLSNQEKLHEITHHYKVVGEKDGIVVLDLEMPDQKDSQNRSIGTLKTVMYLKLLSPDELLIQNCPILHGKIPLPEKKYWIGNKKQTQPEGN